MTSFYVILFIVVILGVSISFCKISIHQQSKRYIVAQNEYQKTFSSINTKSIQELNEMHISLIHLLKEYSLNEHNYTNESFDKYLEERIYNSLKHFENNDYSLKNDQIPLEKQVYGCAYYSDAQKLDEAIVKRINEMSI